MENASKALLIAGGVLITMIVASFGVYLYGVYHEHSENMLAAMSEKEISQFNAKFLVYEDRDLTANEVVSIMNLVRNNNFTKIGNDFQIKIITDGWELKNTIIDTKGCGINKVVMEENEKKYNEICNSFFSKTLENNLYNFRCKVLKYSEETGLVIELLITHRPITN